MPPPILPPCRARLDGAPRLLAIRLAAMSAGDGVVPVIAADCPVPMEEASRFGIMITDENRRIVDFEEKPAQPRSNLASMGIYIFNWN